MKSGVVAVVGRANAGKSTLINVLVGEKVAIVSPKPQTTRDRILGILTRDDYQIVFEDTPGIYKASTLLNARMQKSTENSVKDVDLILFVIDGHEGVLDSDLEMLKKYSSQGVKTICAFTKIDIMPKEKLYSELTKFSDIEGVKVIPVSARKGKNLKELLNEILNCLPEGEPLYSDDVISNRSEKFMIAEIMREKILLLCDKEIPHGVAIIINEFSLREDGKVYDINLDVICEKYNHKAIIIGKQGKKLKEICTFARQGMEKFLDAKVFLTVYVKVKEGWRNNPSKLKEFGYSDENFN
ncbi:MAG: GTPase Era [Clostridia bacterium]|nr:GTPase Era [Clostridia bacterium]